MSNESIYRELLILLNKDKENAIARAIKPYEIMIEIVKKKIGSFEKGK